jgi:hypothetical protein
MPRKFFLGIRHTQGFGHGNSEKICLPSWILGGRIAKVYEMLWKVDNVRVAHQKEVCRQVPPGPPANVRTTYHCKFVHGLEVTLE